MFGPVNIKSLGGASYFVTFIDDASRKVWAYPMKNKSEVFGIFQKFHVVVERETNKLLKCLEQIMVENIAQMHLRNIVTGLA